jgi:hypothetical protein
LLSPSKSFYRLLPSANANSAAKEAEIGTKVEFAGKTYIPANVDPTVLAALRLPSSRGPLAAQPTRELFDEACKRLAEFTALPDRSLRQVAHFIFATWLVDHIPVAPFLWVTSPSAVDCSEFLQPLALFCWRSLLLTADRTAALWTLPMFLGQHCSWTVLS